MRPVRGSRVLVSVLLLSGLASWTVIQTGSAGAVASGVPGTPTASSLSPAPNSPANTAPADDRLLVTVDPGTTPDQAQAIADHAGATIETRAGDTLILDPIAAPGSAALRASATSLATLPQVQVVEPNVQIHAAAVPNDPLFPDQYGLLNAQPGGIRAEAGWNDTPGSRDIVVGVLDSGILTTHPDLVANLWTNRTGINGCGYGTHGWETFTHTCNPIDDDGHGTHVAGILGATGNNGKGVTGVAQRVSLMSLKMLKRDIDGNVSGGIANAIEAIDFALAAKASGVNLRVLQASWDSSTPVGALHSAIARANTAGVLFVTAAGNGLDNDAQPRDLDVSGNDAFPCEDTNPNVICVGASTPTGQLAAFSNYGSAAVDLAAPGYRILSTVPRGVCGTADYCLFDGTSMATPMVSGAAVDILAAEPSLTVSALRTRILESVDQQSSLVGKVSTNGRLDVCKALPNCDGRPSVAPTKPTSVQALARDGSVKLRWSVPDSNGNSFSVSGYEVNGPSGVTSVPFTTTTLTLTGLPNNINSVVRVRAIGTGGSSQWVSKTVRPYAGGYEVEGNGTVTRVAVGHKMPSPITGGISFGFDAARGIAIAPEGTGGYIVDLYGGLHRFRIGASSPLPPVPTGGPYWPGWDIVRGIATSPKGGGYILDGYGGLHPFGPGAGAPPAVARSGPYWSGFDIARGVVVTEAGTNGYVVDGYGGTHRFRVGAGPLPPAASGSPYWPGWNIVRGITLVPGSGGGWVLDGFGVLHPFAAGGSAPARPSSAPYWPGQDRSRGVGL